ncbi:unnamed protein product [Bursaphelenchus okinawaensis]|uniref:BED-type domain-containing protein n=1 Tax=Bursaphelenchus okinawaensis TaxID=465554 RepID=A0A811KUW2_9BILA|nr:unnamed protein product [Bursaphelenchus okinawaensis]CAG9112400.1 unnamed protein product [Bursaphelenchus okinawaensis]
MPNSQLNSPSPLAARDLNQNVLLPNDMLLSPLLNRYQCNVPLPATTSTPNINLTPKSSRRPRTKSVHKTAEVWKFFKQVADHQAATCNHCGKLIQAKNSNTTGMIRHIKSCHSEEYAQLQKAMNLQLRNKLDTIQKFAVNSSTDDSLIDNLENSTDRIPKINAPSYSLSSTPSSSANTTTLGTISSRKEVTDDSGLELSETSEDLRSASTSTYGLTNFNPKEYTNKLIQKNEENSKIELKENVQVKKEGNEDQLVNEVQEEVKQEQVEEVLRKIGEVQRVESKEEQDDDQIATNYIAMMIANGDLPEEIIDNQCFRRFISHLRPEYVMPSLLEFKEKILPHLRNTLIAQK